MSPRLRHLPQGGNTKKPFPLLEMAYEMVCSCFRNCGDCGDCGDCGFCWGSGHALGATRSSVSRTSTPQATRAPASFRAGFFPHRLRFPGFRVSCPGPLVPWFSSSPIPWPLVLRFSCPLDLPWSPLSPHRHLAAGYLRASFASMHSVAWGTFIRRSFGMSLPVVLQIP